MCESMPGLGHGLPDAKSFPPLAQVECVSQNEVESRLADNSENFYVD